MTRFSSLFIALAALVSAVPAHAGIGLLGGASFHSVSRDDGGSTQNYNRDSKLGFVGGLAFSSNFMIANVELDVLYNHRTLSVQPLGVTLSSSSPAIEVPLLVRISLIPSILDIGVGPYAAFNVGSNNLAYNSPDWGGVGSLRVTVPIPGIHLVVDGRYNYGFTDLSDVPLLDLHTREFKVLAGIDIPFSENSEQQ